MIDITLTGTPKESVLFDFDGRLLKIRVAFSNVTGIWSLSLSDPSTEPATALVDGVAVTVGVDILSPYILGIGSLVAVALVRPGEDAGLGELGGRVRLIYGTEAEVEALRA